MKNKVPIITAILVPESCEKTNQELESDIKAESSPKGIPWVEKIKVLSEG